MLFTSTLQTQVYNIKLLHIIKSYIITFKMLYWKIFFQALRFELQLVKLNYWKVDYKP